MKIAARNPAMSLTMPPPNATTTLDRSPPRRDHLLRRRFHVGQPLAAPRRPAGTARRRAGRRARCASARRAVATRPRWSRQRLCPPAPARIAEHAPSAPRSTIAEYQRGCTFTWKTGIPTFVPCGICSASTASHPSTPPCDPSASAVTPPALCARIARPSILRPRPMPRASHSRPGYRPPRKCRAGWFRAYTEAGATSRRLRRRSRS